VDREEKLSVEYVQLGGIQHRQDGLVASARPSMLALTGEGSRFPQRRDDLVARVR
jgi:hypothetical protein